MSDLQLIPSASRLIRSLRDMGYDFCQAVADVVDNSVEAASTAIGVDLVFEGDRSYVRIVDNGHGMNDKQILEALRFGSERAYKDTDLGKFGLGLKTASLSQATRLTVASKTASGTTHAFTWDVGHVIRTNRWEVLPVTDTHIPLYDPLTTVHSGTLVLWEGLERFLGYKHPYGDAARNCMTAMCRSLETHLSMVFHRFLAGRVPGKTISIRVNDVLLEPWDPFCLSEPHTQVLPEESVPIEDLNERGIVTFRPHVLPRQRDFSSQKAHTRAGEPAGWNQQQGFYIYRANRLIQCGGWSNTRVADEHTKLARIAVDVPPALDESFRINVQKMRVLFPPVLVIKAKALATKVCAIAKQTYNRKDDVSPQQLAVDARSTLAKHPPLSSVHPVPKIVELALRELDAPAPPPPPSATPTPAARTPAPPPPLVKTVWPRYTHAEWLSKMMNAATPPERTILAQIAQRIAPETTEPTP